MARKLSKRQLNREGKRLKAKMLKGGQKLEELPSDRHFEIQAAFRLSHGIATEWDEIGRSRTAKLFRDPDGRNVGFFHSKSLHYEDVEGSDEWLDIDTTPEPSDRAGYMWMVRRNRFRFDFAQDYDAEWPEVASFRGQHDLFHGLKAIVHIDPNTKQVTILQLINSSLVQAGTAPTRFRYNGIFTGVDVEYIVDNDYCKENIHISEAAKQALKQAIINKGLDPNGWLAFATKVDLARCDLNPDIAEDEEYEGRIHWRDAKGKLIHFLPLGFALDETEGLALNRQKVRYRLINHHQHGWLLLSAISLGWLKESVGVVTLDPTNYYAGAGDGYVVRFQEGTWAGARDNPLGENAFPVVDEDWMWYGDVEGGLYTVSRVFFPIDTSALPPGAGITAATLYFYVADTGAGDKALGVVQTSQANTGTLVVGDFDECGAVDNPTEGATRSSSVSAGYNGLVLNATGRGWIDDDGITKLGIRGGKDIDDISPISRHYLRLCYSEYTGTDHDPYLRVTYIVSPTVTTQAATSVQATTATGNGNITDTGGENCDERGVEWGTDDGGPYPNSHTDTDSFGSGAFTKGMTGLPPGATVYYRAKAHNSSGWGYGGQQSFETESMGQPMRQRLGRTTVMATPMRGPY